MGLEKEEGSKDKMGVGGDSLRFVLPAPGQPTRSREA